MRYLTPFQRAGLWLAVIITPPAACCWTMFQLTTGVGAAREHSATGSPLPASTSATAAANSSDANRVS